VSATPPEAKYEYSRGPRASGTTRTVILAGALLGAALLLVAEFTTLYTVHEAGRTAAINSEGTGPHHAFAMVPLALLAGALAAFGVYNSSSRPALLAIGAVGVLGLLIALLGDLPDAHSHGITRGFVLATATPTTGLYLETLGPLLLVRTRGRGLGAAAMPSGAAPRRRRTASPV
jgi:hypothetical protein